MGVRLNHTIAWCSDKRRSANFLTDLLGLDPPTAFGPFLVVELWNDVSIDFHDIDGIIAPQHYAFLISEKKSMRFSVESATEVSITGPTQACASRVKSVEPMAGGASISRILTTTSWRSSPALTEVADQLHGSPLMTPAPAMDQPAGHSIWVTSPPRTVRSTTDLRARRSVSPPFTRIW